MKPNRASSAGVAPAALALGLLWAGGCAPRRAEPPPPTIVLISIDTLRADRLAAWGRSRSEAGGGPATPAIDRLVRDGVLFERAWSPCPLTLPAHVSLLSGLDPPRHGVRDNVGFPVSAADRFDASWLPAAARSAGYSTAAFVSAFVLRGDTGLAHGFDRFDAPTGEGGGEALDLAQRPGSVTFAAARRWLDESTGPRLLFVHLYEPHAPYAPPEPYRAVGEDPYDGEIAAADAAVGELLAELDRAGLYDAAAIVLLSDHGEGLGDHGERQHGVFLYESTLHVPLVVKLPGRARAGERVADPVGLVDVAPTLLRLLGRPVPEGLDGRDLLVDRDPARGLYAESWYSRFHFGWSPLHAWIESDWYLIEGPRPQLFDARIDRAQQHDLLPARRTERARMLRLLEPRQRDPAPPADVDAQTARSLAALGYLAAAGGSDGADVDPRTRRALLANWEQALDDYWAGRHDRAAAELQALVAAEPRMLDAWGFLARLLDRMGRDEEALVAWRQVLALSGGRPATAGLVAERLVELGQFDEALALAAALDAGEPVRALEIRAGIDLSRGEAEAARARVRAAVAAGVVSEPLVRRFAFEQLAAGDAAGAVAWLVRLAGEAVEESTRIVHSLALAESGRGAEAEALLAATRAASPDESGFLGTLGTVLLDLGRTERAEVALRESTRLRPDRVATWNALGVAQLRLGRLEAARESWQRAAALDPASPDAWWNLAAVAVRLGDATGAQAALEAWRPLVPEAHRAAADRAAEQLLARLPTALR